MQRREARAGGEEGQRGQEGKQGGIGVDAIMWKSTRERERDRDKGGQEGKIQQQMGKSRMKCVGWQDVAYSRRRGEGTCTEWERLQRVAARRASRGHY